MSTPKRTPAVILAEKEAALVRARRRVAELEVRDDARWTAIRKAVRALDAIPDRKAFGEEVSSIVADAIVALEAEADKIAGLET